MNFQINGDQVILSKSELMKILEGDDTPEQTPEPKIDKPKSLEMVITDYLLKANIRRGIRGFNYLRTAITMRIENPERCHSMTALYKAIGDMNNSTPSKIERCIRHSIVTAFIGKDKPCNSEFIASAADTIKLEMN